ncbi:MAG: hypothetical protein M3457_18170 [Chloroflexota bacterium]|nr:hypothetical protein [Chloroflexota bacterium]
MTSPHVERVVVDLRANRLLLEIDRPLPQTGRTPATIDIGALGRLIGVEIAGVYLSISDPVPGSELQGRSVDTPLEIADNRRQVVIPRRGSGWELSFPSGNQCWNQTDDDGGTRPLCSVLVGV